MKIRVREHEFISNGLRCAGCLYLPEGKKPGEHFPVVVMAHGLGAERTFRLPAYAEYFTGRGLACFLFDYRYIGDSQGNPRHLVNPFKQLDDWRAALAHVREISSINKEKIGLFGTSFSGGHVLSIAAEDKDIACLVSQVPFVDPFSSIRMSGFGQTLKGSYLAALDVLRFLTFHEPLYVPVVAEAGTFAFLNTPDSFEGYSRLLPPETDWENKICARLGFTIGAYRPIGVVHRIDCPVLILAAEQDSLISSHIVRRTAERIKNCKCFLWPMKHFEIYVDDWFEKAVAVEADFYVKHLL